MKQNDDFDRILNDALSQYRDAEPLAGIEDRVLRRVQMQAAQRSSRWQWMAVPALGLLAVLVWLSVHHLSSQHSAPEVVQQKAPASATPSQVAADRAPEKRVEAQRTSLKRSVVHARRPLARVQGVPVLAQFPSPAPLDREGRALLALARTDPEALRALVQDETLKDIAPISIQPLEQTSIIAGEN
jgi:hypothetical protein